MDRVPVRSSNVRAVGYDAGTGTLEVEFHSGAVYEYFNVPAAVYEGLIAASSKGSYLNTHIKTRYQFKQVR